MEFESKKGLLEYLGKNPKDNKLVDRMVLRGEVRIEDGMYVLVENEAEALRKENEELKQKLREVSFTGVADGDELHEAKVNAEYWEKECRRYGRLINNVISVCYRKLKGMLGSKFTMSEEEFREGVIEEVKMGEG